jgi:hypothetical protein
MIMHPSTTTLQRYALDEAGPKEREQIAAHLLHCRRCRQQIDEIISLREELRGLADTPIPSHSWDRIRERLEEGERLILPAETSVRAPALRSRTHAVAAAVIILAAAIAVFGRPQGAEANRSELHFGNVTPRAGAEIPVTYTPSTLFGDAESLVLRARFRTARNHVFTARAGELVRERDGRYRGVVQLPDSVVYAVFAVEDLEAQRLDSNHERGWDLLVHASDGRPLFEAMDQKAQELRGRNWELAVDVARERAALYPDEMLSWKELFFYERSILGGEGLDSLRASQRVLLRDYHRQFSEKAELSGDEAGEMFWYARLVEDSSLIPYWRDRLVEEYPTHALAVQQRTMELWMEHRSDPERYLAAIERLWDEVGPAHELLMREGLETAQRIGSPEAVLRWADRFGWPFPDEAFGEVLVRYPELREEGMRRLRARIRRIEQGREEDRDLFWTVVEQRRASGSALRSTFAHLGNALLDRGQVHAGLDTLSLAVSGGWDPVLFRKVADARLAAGDTVGAMDVWARVAVDPGTREAFADTVQTKAGRHFVSSHWASLLQTATEQMRTRVLAGATSRSIRGSARVTDGEGRTHRVSDLTGRTPAVVVFWSRFCGPAIEALPAIVRLADRLRAEGVPLVLITEEAPSADFQNFMAGQQANLSIYHDTQKEAALAFNKWGTPQYFVLDPTGRVRFVHHAIGQIRRQVAVLWPLAERTTTAMPDG